MNVRRLADILAEFCHWGADDPVLVEVEGQVWSIESVNDLNVSFYNNGGGRAVIVAGTRLGRSDRLVGRTADQPERRESLCPHSKDRQPLAASSENCDTTGAPIVALEQRSRPTLRTDPPPPTV